MIDKNTSTLQHYLPFFKNAKLLCNVLKIRLVTVQNTDITFYVRSLQNSIRSKNRSRLFKQISKVLHILVLQKCRGLLYISSNDILTYKLLLWNDALLNTRIYLLQVAQVHWLPIDLQYNQRYLKKIASTRNSLVNSYIPVRRSVLWVQDIFCRTAPNWNPKRKNSLMNASSEKDNMLYAHDDSLK